MVCDGSPALCRPSTPLQVLKIFKQACSVLREARTSVLCAVATIMYEFNKQLDPKDAESRQFILDAAADLHQVGTVSLQALSRTVCA